MTSTYSSPAMPPTTRVAVCVSLYCRSRRPEIDTSAKKIPPHPFRFSAPRPRRGCCGFRAKSPLMPLARMEVSVGCNPVLSPPSPDPARQAGPLTAALKQPGNPFAQPGTPRIRRKSCNAWEPTVMDLERWRQIESLYHSASELDSEHWARFLAELAPGISNSGVRSSRSCASLLPQAH
jgi:hypothetical protein